MYFLSIYMRFINCMKTLFKYWKMQSCELEWKLFKYVSITNRYIYIFRYDAIGICYDLNELHYYIMYTDK